MTSMSSDDNSFLEIDIHQLEREWAGQPDLYKQYADELADARTQLDELESKLDVVKAQLDRDIRDRPSYYGLPETKTTEGAIKACVLDHKKHKAAVVAVQDARHRVNILQGAVVALDHRKKALEKLVDLWMGGYYSTPRVKGETRERFEETRTAHAFTKGHAAVKRNRNGSAD